MTAKKLFYKFRARHFSAAVLASMVILLFNGCAPETEVALKPVPDQVSTYKAGDLYRKDYLFDQPSSDKKTIKNTELNTEVVYDQVTKDVDAEGNITDDITIKAIKYLNSDSEGVNIDYDSSRKAEAGSAFTMLIGQTYTIKMSPDYKVLEISNIEPVRQAIKKGKDNRFAGVLVSDESIHKRHEILAMPDKDKKTLKVGDSWSRVVSSPPGVLIPKNYEKIYTVEEISKSGLAMIKMNATPTSKRLINQPKESEGFEMFKSFFDSEDDYTGNLLIDTETGRVYEYNESLKSKYTAADFPKTKPKPEQPDVLNLAFTESHSIELLD
jgi:hypothetical protein